MELSVLHGAREDYPDGGRVDAGVRHWAQRTPGAPALRWRGQAISYAELMARAERIAAAARSRGVRPGDIVAVRVAHGPDLVAALLGVLLCDAAYAAVPAEWPLPRYAELVRQAGVRLRIGDPGEPPVAGEDVLPLPEALAAPAPDGGADPGAPARAGTDPCCVFLTSGSTGVPKVVLAPHRGIVRVALDPLFVLLDAPMVMLQSAIIAWDVFALELWVPLLRGGTCVLGDGTPLSAVGIRQAIRQGVNTIGLPAVLLNSVVEDDPDCLAGLSLLITGAERASSWHLAECLRRYPALRMVHGYGPVESTIACTACLVEPGLLHGADVPIGTPVVNSSVFVLDERRAIVSRGTVGEVAIAGDGLALGYVGDDEQTRERFPVLDLDGSRTRVYLTGDLGFIDAEGMLVFTGRRDRQAKIRGVRVELEEIERKAETLPVVARAAVLALPVGAVTKTSTALFYTAANTSAPDGVSRAAITPEAVTRELAGLLPAAFVPTVVRRVPAMPLLANGKLDQSALAALLPEAGRDGPGDRAGRPARPAAGAASGASITLVLEEVAALLGGAIGADDDLFANGATSLTAIRLASRLARQTGSDVTAGEVLQAGTPAAVAAVLDEHLARHRERAAEQPAEQDAGQTGQHARPPGLAGFWLLSRTFPSLTEQYISLVYRFSAGLDAGLLSGAIDAVVNRHEALRTIYPEQRGEPVQQVLPEVRGLLERDPRTLSPEAAVRDAREYVYAPFALTEQPPLRARLMPLTDGGFLLAMSAHHIAMDGVSARLVFRDLADAYKALLSGGQPFASEPPAYYETLAAQARRWQARSAAALAYWSELVAGVGLAPFPGAEYRPPFGPVGNVPMPVTDDLLLAASRSGAAVGGTALAVLLAAYVQVLRRHTGAADLLVAVPAAGRMITEAEEAVGNFAGAFPVRLPADVTEPGQLLRAAAGQLRAAASAPPLPYERLGVLPPGRARINPLSQVYLHVDEGAPVFDLPGTDNQFIDIPWPNAIPDIYVDLLLPRAGGRLQYRTDAIAATDAERLAREIVAESWALVRGDAPVAVSGSSGAGSAAR